MGPQSPFSSRVRPRAVLPPISLQRVFREVRTEDELRQALQPPTAPTGLAGFLAGTGRRIVIAAPITLTSPIVIGPGLPGTTIEAQGLLPIFPGAEAVDAFDIRAPLVTIRGLLLYADVERNRRFGRAFVLTRDANTQGPTQCRFRDCFVVGGNALLEDTTAGDANNGIIADCFFQPFAADVANDCVSLDSSDWGVDGNTLQPADTGVSFRLGVNGARARVVGNSINGGGIDTSASAGFSTISANTDAGTVNAAATDDTLGGNT